MTLEVPQWVRLACQKWGRQKRRIWSGAGEWYLDQLGRRARHIDGYAESFLARVQDEKVGAGSSTELRQHWAEVYWGEGLDVQRNIFGMPEEPLRALHLAFVFDPEFGLTVPQKAALIGLSRTTYCVAVTFGQSWVWARLDPQNRSDSQVLERPNEILPLSQKKPTIRREKPLAELSLQSLQRPTLSRRR